MIEVATSQLSQSPYQQTGLLLVHWPNGTSTRATCSLVGRNDILTAGHCVYNPDRGGWASSYDVYFGTDYNSSTATFEHIEAHPVIDKFTVKAWPDKLYVDADNTANETSEIPYDLAIIGIDQAIGEQIGWLPIAPGYDGSLNAISLGYPAGSTGLMRDTLEVSSNDHYATYRNPVLTMGNGSSGGPLLVDGYVIGVKSTSYSWADIGNRLIYDDLLAAMAANDDLLANAAVNRKNPLISLSATKYWLSAGESSRISFLLSEASSDFTLSDISVSGGQLSQFSGSSHAYSAVFTPDSNAFGRAEIQVGSRSFRDAAGNYNADGSDYDNTLSFGFANLVSESQAAGKLRSDEGVTSQLQGSSGNDFYLIANAGSSIRESSGGGQDSVFALVDFTLPAELEHLTLLGDARQGSGNALANALTGNAQANRIAGLAGDDLLIGGGGSDTLDGGSGTDCVRYDEVRSHYQLSREGSGWQVLSTDGSRDSLIGVERLRFADSGLVLDSDAKAGQIAGILTAIFGPGGQQLAAYAGIGLRLLDAGMTYQDVAALAISASGKVTNEEIVTLLWQNLMGQGADMAGAQPYVERLADSMSLGVLGALAADYALAAGVVDLAGLAQNGLAFTD